MCNLSGSILHKRKHIIHMDTYYMEFIHIHIIWKHRIWNTYYAQAYLHIACNTHIVLVCYHRMNVIMLKNQYRLRSAMCAPSSGG